MQGARARRGCYTPHFERVWAANTARTEGGRRHLDHYRRVAAAAIKVEAAEVDAAKRAAGVVSGSTPLGYGATQGLLRPFMRHVGPRQASEDQGLTRRGVAIGDVAARRLDTSAEECVCGACVGPVAYLPIRWWWRWWI